MSSKLIAMREQNARGASRRGSLFASQTLASPSTQSISRWLLISRIVPSTEEAQAICGDNFSTFLPPSESAKGSSSPQRRLLNLMDSFRRLSSRPHCWWWLLLRAVMASLMEAICLWLIRNASQSPQQPHNHHHHTEQCKALDLIATGQMF